MREIATEPLAVPASLAPLVAGYAWARDTVGEAGASVHRLHAPGRTGLYLKHGAGEIADAVTGEMARMRWLGQRLGAPAVRGFVLDDAGAWLLMTAVVGRTAYRVLADEPGARNTTVRAIAAHLRMLHAIPVAECPFDSGHHVRMAQARLRIDAGMVDVDDFGDAHERWTAEQVWDEVAGLLPLAPDPVVTHGDFSLDNILMAEGSVIGLIDLDRVGVADRYQDLAILADCLDEFGGELRERMFAAYGVSEADTRKLRFHLALDELF